MPDGSYALSYRITVSDGRVYFADAREGRILQVADAFKSQSAVGVGTGFRGQRGKLGTTRTGNRFQAHDRLRPAEIVTIDLRFNVDGYVRLLFEHFEGGLASGVPVWNTHDVASDAEQRLGRRRRRRGPRLQRLDLRLPPFAARLAGTRRRQRARLQHRQRRLRRPGRHRGHAALRPGGLGVYVFGRATDDASEEPLTSLEFVAHELMHGVTHFAVSRRPGDPLGLGTDLPSSARLGPESFTTEEGETFQVRARAPVVHRRAVRPVFGQGVR